MKGVKDGSFFTLSLETENTLFMRSDKVGPHHSKGSVCSSASVDKECELMTFILKDSENVFLG